jgi:hypothetical protein
LSASESIAGIQFTQDFVRRLYACAKEGVAAGKSLRQIYQDARRELDPIYGQYPIYEHCMPFDVARAYDEASGTTHPRIWTAERDVEMWRSLEI